MGLSPLAKACGSIGSSISALPASNSLVNSSIRDKLFSACGFLLTGFFDGTMLFLAVFIFFLLLVSFLDLFVFFITAFVLIAAFFLETSLIFF
jgi:hypothetical protein